MYMYIHTVYKHIIYIYTYFTYLYINKHCTYILFIVIDYVCFDLIVFSPFLQTAIPCPQKGVSIAIPKSQVYLPGLDCPWLCPMKYIKEYQSCWIQTASSVLHTAFQTELRPLSFSFGLLLRLHVSMPGIA